MKRIQHLLTVAIGCLFIQAAYGRDYIATEHHIVGDGKTLNTTAFQKLIDRVSQAGGGRIVLTAGRYLTGEILLQSGVEIHLEKDATILGSTSPFDYYNIQSNSAGDELNDNAHLALIASNGAKDIAITGTGTIDGQGLELALHADSLHHSGVYVDKHYNTRRQRPSELVRPTLFYLYNTQGIRVESVRLKNSSNWGLSLNVCSQVEITGVNILNRAYWNNDGIDITDCQHVTISGCYVDSADDGICLKSYHPDRRNEHISISDCEIRSSASAIKFGTASYGGFCHVDIRNIRIFDTFRSAIAIESVDGGVIDDINVDGITAVNTGNAIFIRLGQRGGDRKGILKNVRLANISVQIPFGRPDINYDLRGPEVDYFHNIHPSSICGIPDNNIENVVLENITVTHPGRATKGMAYMPTWRLSSVPENIEKYPEFSMFGELPAWGFYVRHAKNVTFRNVRLNLADADFRPAFVLDDALNVTIDNLCLPLSKRTAQIVLHNSTCAGNFQPELTTYVK